ncbi:hypothetical protein [Amycolatopsis sp. H20-H5]|uniref:hypothetical protein n=1 Tax=Amycolatopsis sp. H20-H5 TaxID=3046309 RepID=UPI002DB7E29D|nr:hypothetical protein [Amycolatopsis sp. H20-H5]MEC3978196.1 hypothetical protein [Amycolatopsis sp. H20-H5]
MAGLIIGVALLFLGSSAVAQPAPWEPSVAVPGGWKGKDVHVKTSPIRVGTSSDDADTVQVCTSEKSSWSEAKLGLDLTIHTVTCPNRKTAEQTNLGFQSNYAALRNSSVLSDDADHAFIPADSKTIAYGRQWLQGNSIIVILTYCSRPGDVNCLQLNGELSKSFSGAFPGSPSAGGQAIIQDTASFAMTSLALPWVLWVGVAGLVAKLGADRYRLPGESANFIDTRKASRSLRMRSLWYGVSIGAIRVLLALLLLGAISLFYEFSLRILLVGALAGFLLTCSVLLRRKLNNPLYSGRVYTLTRRVNVRTVTGACLRFAAGFLMMFTLFTYLLVCFSAALGGPRGAFMGIALRNFQLAIEAGSAGFFDYVRYYSIWASGSAASVGYAVVLCATFLFAIDRMGVYLQVRDAKDALRADGRLPILYLRNFGDDKLKVRASRVSRRGVLGRLSVTRKRKFEETVAWRVNSFANIIAVNDPGNFLPTLGAAKFNLAHSDWKIEVERLASSSFAVLVSATPTTINEGLRWELDMIANRLRHGRVVLLLAPRKKDELIYSWKLFVDSVRDLSFFDGVRDINPTGAAQVITHIPGVGWRAWGATTRTEWTYTVAIQSALTEMARHAGPTTENMNAYATAE